MLTQEKEDDVNFQIVILRGTIKLLIKELVHYAAKVK